MDNKIIKELISDKHKEIINGNTKELINICNALGRKYLENQRYPEAIAEHKEELKYSLQIKCLLSEAVARRALGECYSENNEYNLALNEHKKYLKLAQTLKDPVEIQRAYATIGRTHYVRAQELKNRDVNYTDVLNRAHEAYSKSLDICKQLKSKIPEKDLSQMSSRLYINLGCIYELMGEYDKSITNYNASIAFIQKHNLKEDLFLGQSNLASIYVKNNELEKALEAYEEAYKTAKTMKNKINICDVLFENGLVLMRMNRFSESRKMFKKAFKVKCPIPEEHEKYERHLKIASMICDHSRQLSEEDKLEVKINLCDKLGDHFCELKMFDIAVEFYKTELNYSLQINSSDSEIAPIYGSIAQTYSDDNKFKESIEYWEHQRNCNRDNPIEETKSLLNIAEMKECLKREDLNHEIAQIYETALEKISNLDDNILSDTLQKYFDFLTESKLDSDKAIQIKDRLNTLTNTQTKTTTIEMAEEEDDETDIYDAYDLSNLSDDSDEEQLPKRTCEKHWKANVKGETPLHLACIDGDLKKVEKLLADKHPTNVRDCCGWTPLHEACIWGHTAVVKLLIENGADINENKGIKTEGWTPLQDACHNFHMDVIELLLDSGAKVSLLNHFNETALEVLQTSKEESIMKGELDICEIKIIETMERRLQKCLDKEGFDRKSIEIINTLNRFVGREKRKHRPHFRRDDPDSDHSDGSLDIPINKFRDNGNSCSNQKNKCDKSIDFDDPKVARKEYCSSISNLKRNSNRVSEVRPKFKPIPAILDESQVIDDDQWLIDDVNEKKKRSCLDAYDAFNKKPKSYEPNQLERTRKSKSRVSAYRSNSSDQMVPDEDSMSSDIEIECLEPIEVKSEEIVEIDCKINKSKVSINSDKKPMNVIVVFNDTDNTSLMIPIKDLDCEFSWLKREAQLKYSENFGIKPEIHELRDTNNAVLSDHYNIVRLLDRNCGQHKVLAKVMSWNLDPLDKRYEQICRSCGTYDYEDIVKELQITQINGIFSLTNINLPLDQMKPILRALHKQNNLREFDISFSNVVIDCSQEVFKCLEMLPSLQILNLKGTRLTKPNLQLLATKLCPDLVELNLSFNTFGDEFSELIVKVIKQFPKLNSIDLCACDLTNQFLQSSQFKDCIKNSNLSSVVVDYNAIDPEFCQQFRKL